MRRTWPRKCFCVAGGLEANCPRYKIFGLGYIQVGLNAARDLRRSAWKRRAKPLLGVDIMTPVDHASPVAELEDRERLDRVRRRLARPAQDEEKEVFLLRQNGELTFEQIAEATSPPCRYRENPDACRAAKTSQGIGLLELTERGLSTMLGCPACQEQMLDHLYGLLDEVERQEFLSHLDACRGLPSCNG
jgi:hypothetical protein